jgi:hypothetical protein
MPTAGRQTHWTACAALAAVLVSTACTAPRRVETETAPAADFGSRHTFAWQESQAAYDPQPGPPEVEAVKRTIRDTVVEQLSLKGFKEVQGAEPDFLVSFHLVVTLMTEPALCVRRHVIFNYPGAPPPLKEVEVCDADPLLPTATLRQGTLVVFVVDPETRNLLWQGAVVGAEVSRRNNTESLRAAVTQMLQEFPLGPA